MSLPHQLNPEPFKTKNERRLYHSQAHQLPKMTLEKESPDYKNLSAERSFDPAICTTAVDVKVDLLCTDLTQLRGIDKFKQMSAGSLHLKCSKASLVSQLKARVADQICSEFPDLSQRFKIVELRLGTKLALPESVRLYSLFHKEFIKVTAILKPVEKLNLTQIDLRKSKGSHKVAMIKGLKTIFENNYQSPNKELLDSLMSDKSSVFGSKSYKRNILGLNSIAQNRYYDSGSQTIHNNEAVNILTAAHDIDLNTVSNVPNNSFEETQPDQVKKKSRFRLSKRDAEPVLKEIDRNCSSQLLLDKFPHSHQMHSHQNSKTLLPKASMSKMQQCKIIKAIPRSKDSKMSHKALTTFISMNFVPNLGRKGGQFRESDSNFATYDQVRTLAQNGSVDTDPDRERSALKASNYSKILMSERDREIANQTAPVNDLISIVTDNESCVASKEGIEGLLPKNPAAHTSQAWSRNVQQPYGASLKNPLKTSIPQMRVNQPNRQHLQNRTQTLTMKFPTRNSNILTSDVFMDKSTPEAKSSGNFISKIQNQLDESIHQSSYLKTRQDSSRFCSQLQSTEMTTKQAMRRAALQIAAFAKRKLSIEDEIQIIGDDKEVEDDDCIQAVIDLDCMGIHAATEMAMDFQSYRNVLYLFLLSELGPQIDHGAIEAQRRILKLIVDTMTCKCIHLIYDCITEQKASFIVQEPLVFILLDVQKVMPHYLKQKIIMLLLKVIDLATYESLKFELLQRMMLSKSHELSEAALKATLSRVDPSKNVKWHTQRAQWITSITEGHVQMFLQFTQAGKYPNQIVHISRRILTSLARQSDLVKNVMSQDNQGKQILLEEQKTVYSTMKLSLQGKIEPLLNQAFASQKPIKQINFQSKKTLGSQLIVGETQLLQTPRSPQFIQRKGQTQQFSFKRNMPILSIAKPDKGKKMSIREKVYL